MSNNTLAIMKLKAYKKYKTHDNTFSDFPVGTHVKIITPICDFSCFYGETGKVISNSGKYLGIEIRFDNPRKFRDGTTQMCFNFNPIDLWVMPADVEKTKAKETTILKLARYSKWWVGTKYDKSPDIRKNVAENEIRTVGWIAAMNDVRQLIRDMSVFSKGQINESKVLDALIGLDQILQKEIEG